ncbi:MAG: hypothetical protein IPH45_17530 [Bacteroidales bacterium]|nr:hypothetical protein [Bacteroidales bacterium]
MPAEFEKNEGILVRWPYQADMDSTIAELVKHISSEGKTWILFDASNVSCDTLCITNFLANQGASYDSLFSCKYPLKPGE